MKEYEVRFVEAIKRDGEIQGGDDHCIKIFKTEKSAIKYGKKKSFQKTYRGAKVHEIFIRCLDEENDRVSVWFIKDGKITHKDVG
jgi:hypothetical protein